MWQWRYWGKGNFTPMNARWDVRGTGEWRDNVIELTDLSTGFNKLQYGTMLVSKPRPVLDHPVRWSRDPDNPTLAARSRSMPGKQASRAEACCRRPF